MLVGVDGMGDYPLIEGGDHYVGTRQRRPLCRTKHVLGGIRGFTHLIFILTFFICYINITVLCEIQIQAVIEKSALLFQFVNFKG